MKASIKLEYHGKVYTSDYKKVTETELFEMQDFIETVIQGKVDWLSFRKDNQTFYFGKRILEESILTISEMSLSDVVNEL